VIISLEWEPGSPGTQRGGPNVLVGDLAAAPSWTEMTRTRAPGWYVASPRQGSHLIAELLEALPPGRWHVRIWYDQRTEEGPNAELHLSAMAWRSVPGLDLGRDHRTTIEVPWWVDLEVLPLAAVMEVMSS
jgi:hypothetical protein